MVLENIFTEGKYTETAIHLIHVLKINNQFLQVMLTFIITN